MSDPTEDARSPRRWPRAPLVAGAVVGVLVVAGAAVGVSWAMNGSSSQAEPPPVAQTESPPADDDVPHLETPSPTVTPTVVPPAAFVMPACESLASGGVADLIASGKLVLIQDDSAQTLVSWVAGPVAAAAALASPQVRTCTWGYAMSDGGVEVSIAAMSEAEWGAFAAQLTAGGWTAADLDGAPGFSQVDGVNELTGEPRTWWYLYDSGAWITFTENSTPETRSAAIAGLRAANP